MNRCAAILRVLITLAFVVLPVLSLDGSGIDLFIGNQSGNPLLIKYSCEREKPARSKLLESDAMINFGKVYEASVQSYSTLGNYVAPELLLMFYAT